MCNKTKSTMDFIYNLIDESGVDNLKKELEVNEGFDGFTDDFFKKDIYINSKILSEVEKAYINTLYKIWSGKLQLHPINHRTTQYTRNVKLSAVSKIKTETETEFNRQIKIKMTVITMKKLDLSFPISTDKNTLQIFIDWFRKYSQNNKHNADYVKYIDSYFATHTELGYDYDKKIEIIIFTISLVSLGCINIEYGYFMNICSMSLAFLDGNVKITFDIEKFVSIFSSMKNESIVLHDYIAYQTKNEKNNHYYGYVLSDLIDEGYVTSKLLCDIAYYSENARLIHMMDDYIMEKSITGKKGPRFTNRTSNNDSNEFTIRCFCERCTKYKTYLETSKDLPMPTHTDDIDDTDDMDKIAKLLRQ